MDYKERNFVGCLVLVVLGVMLSVALFGCSMQLAGPAISAEVFHKGEDPRPHRAIHNTRSYMISGQTYAPTSRPGEGGMSR